MIRVLILTAAFDLAVSPLGGIAASVRDSDFGSSGVLPALWLVAVGLACMAVAYREDRTADSRRLSETRALA